MLFFVNMVSREGLEPSTPGLKGPCSNQLSYRPPHGYIIALGKAKCKREIGLELSDFGALLFLASASTIDDEDGAESEDDEDEDDEK